MASTEPPLIVIGHKNPDTDSICSAIAYSHYKREVCGLPATPYRAGNLNPQTSFVLNHFGVPHPELLTTLLPHVSDIMIHGTELLSLTENDTVGMAQEIITGKRFAFLPVTGNQGRYVGKVSAVRLAGLLQDFADLCRNPVRSIRFQRFLEAIEARMVSGEAPDSFHGRIVLSQPGREPAVEELPCILISCDPETTGSRIDLNTEDGVSCRVTSPLPPLEVAARLFLSMPLRDLIERQHPVFKPGDLVRNVHREIRKSNEGGFCVVDDDGVLRGVITRVSFLSPWRFRVALVDHNELSQSVDGVEEASVEEIIDHHRLGYRSTDQPITFINKVVGCTSTIIAELYRNAGSTPPPPVAGLMLSAILSDTVILQSPTTTPLDCEMADWLAKLANEDLKDFGTRMFAAGCALDEANPQIIIRQDLKVYEESGWKLAVSQMETVGFEAFKDLSGSLAAELEHAMEESDCHFGCLMVTDITCSTSLLLCAGDRKIIDAITYPRVGVNLFKMSGVLSRKKQMIPYLADLIRQLKC